MPEPPERTKWQITIMLYVVIVLMSVVVMILLVSLLICSANGNAYQTQDEITVGGGAFGPPQTELTDDSNYRRFANKDEYFQKFPAKVDTESKTKFENKLKKNDTRMTEDNVAVTYISEADDKNLLTVRKHEEIQMVEVEMVTHLYESALKKCHQHKTTIFQANNVAYKKVAQMSSTQSSATLAVDGKDNLQRAYCAASKLEPLPWLRVDLEELYFVKEVQIYTSKDKSAWNMHDLEVRVKPFLEMDKITNDVVCGRLEKGGFPPGITLTTICPHCMIGRFIEVQITKPCSKRADCHVNIKDNVLTICEIQVIGYKVIDYLRTDFPEESSTTEGNSDSKK